MLPLAIIFLLSIGSTLGGEPTRRWYPDSVGANFFQTNGFEGNQLVASYIMPGGNLIPGSATSTGGNGSASINDPDPYQNHPDPFLGGGSVIVAGKYVYAVNAGSDSFSAFSIDPADPAQLTWCSTYPSYGEYPVSLAASSNGSLVCVLNGGAVNGFACFMSEDDGSLSHLESWDRILGLNLTTPPHGPVGGGPSQMTFNDEMTSLIVAVKGKLPTDLNNPSGKFEPGFVATFSIDMNTMSLATNGTLLTVGVPFSIEEDKRQKGLYFMADVSTGYASFELGDGHFNVSQGVIVDQKAVCWSAQSNRTGHYYVVDTVGKSNITEISLDETSLNGTTVSHLALGVNASGTDISLASLLDADYFWVNAPAYYAIHSYKIEGPGNFTLIQRVNFNHGGVAEELGLTLTPGFAGQAVYLKDS